MEVRVPADLPALIRRVRTHPGVLAKAEIGLVSQVFGDTDWMAGPGDDGAIVPVAGVCLVVGAEETLGGSGRLVCCSGSACPGRHSLRG